MVESHTHPGGLNHTLLSEGCVPEMALTVGTVVSVHSKDGGWGGGRGGGEVGLTGKVVVISPLGPSPTDIFICSQLLLIQRF